MSPTTKDSKSVQPPDRSSAPLERVRNHTLPERSVRLIESYEEVVGDRDRFLWKWAHHLFPKFTLSCTAPEYVEKVQNAKLEGLMFVSILDDVAEMHNDRTTFEEAAKIPFDHQPVNYDRDTVDREVLAFASDVWDEFSPTIQQGPQAADFEEIVRFDLKQILNAMEYSYLANHNLAVLNRSELQTYDAHNMMLFGFADIDLVYSPTFERHELSTLRQVIERAQRMVRIGNWITTWERELSEGDFTSGIVAYALERDVVSADDLRASRNDARVKDSETIIRTIRDHGIEDVFLRQWHEELAAAREFEGEFDSVDVETYLDGIETVMEYHSRAGD